MHKQPALPPLNHNVEFPKPGATAPTSVTEEKVSDVSYDFLQREFSEVFDIQNYRKPSLHDAVHHIVMKGPPVHCHVRRLSPECLMILRKEIQRLIDLDVIEPSRSSWASPVHLVPKSDPGQFRITGDYRLLNNQTEPDRYLLPFLHDFAGNLHGARIFSNLDLYKGYHQIRIAKEDAPKTAIITPIGSFQFRRMPMGLSSSAQTFQRFLDEVLRGLTFAFWYVDDILIFSKGVTDHKEHLRQVFSRLRCYGLILNKNKCEFGVPEIRFLGHVICNKGMRPIPAKVEAIHRFSLPSSIYR